jgi:hypothetical protein
MSRKKRKKDVLRQVAVDSKASLTPVYSNVSVKKGRLTRIFPQSIRDSLAMP